MNHRGVPGRIVHVRRIHRCCLNVTSEHARSRPCCTLSSTSLIQVDASFTHSHRPADDKMANRPRWKTDQPLIHPTSSTLSARGGMPSPRSPGKSFVCVVRPRSGENCAISWAVSHPARNWPPHIAWARRHYSHTAISPLVPLVRSSRRDAGRQAHHLLPSEAMTADVGFPWRLRYWLTSLSHLRRAFKLELSESRRPLCRQ
jgi:hypothetical protein